MANKEQLWILRQGVDLWNRWREMNPFIVPNFSNIPFKGKDLSGVNLKGANLRGAKLIGTILQRADLTGADLSGAELIEVDLSRTNLSQSILFSSTFKRVNFQETILDSARFGATTFIGTDISLAKGLKFITHIGISYLDIDLLFRSSLALPESFLRGCGVPEIMLEYLSSMRNEAIQFYSCFISYSSEDKVFARRVHDTLQGRGIRCWLDEKQMLPGDDPHQEIDRGIRMWDKVLLCCSKTSLTISWWVDHEVNKAFQKERDLMKERGEKVLALIPLDLDGYLFSEECGNPKRDEVKARITANFTGWERDNAIFEREIEKVIRALRTDGGKEPPPTPKL